MPYGTVLDSIDSDFIILEIFVQKWSDPGKILHTINEKIFLWEVIKMSEDSFPVFKMTLLIVFTIFVIGLGSFAMRCVQNKYIVTEYNSQKIVATVVCTEKKTILRIPPFPDKKETTFVYDGVAITTNSDEVYAECEKGKSYQAIIKIATHKKNGKKLYFLENIANEPVSENVNE